MMLHSEPRLLSEDALLLVEIDQSTADLDHLLKMNVIDRSTVALSVWKTL